MSKPLASLSLDLDNKWSYLKTRGGEGWKSFPSYLDLLIPRVLDMLARRNLKITFFVVGQDAARPENRAALEQIAAAGHEIGNHSFHHEPWLHLYSREQLLEEVRSAEEAIERVTGQRPRGFRGPGYSFSPELLELLASRGYEYDGSTFPTYLGPLARLYYFMSSGLSRKEREQRDQLFGSWKNGFRPLKPYLWTGPARGLLEIPVTTMPVLKMPIQPSYVLFAARFSVPLALAYYRAGLGMCRLAGVQPSILLHPLDFLSAGDGLEELRFFPAMDIPTANKLAVMERLLDILAGQFRVVPMAEHAREAMRGGARLPEMEMAGGR